MTLQELVSAVRENLQDPAGTRWTDQLITRYLNEAQKMLAPFSYSLTYWETAFAAGQDEVGRPADLLVPNRVTFRVDNDEWELVRQRRMPDTPATLQGSPSTVYFLSDSIHLRPVPSRAGTLRVSGTQRPPDLVYSSDEPSMVDAEPVLIAYATWVCLAADVDPAAQIWRDLFEQRRREWMIFDSMRNPQSSEIRSSWWWS